VYTGEQNQFSEQLSLITEGESGKLFLTSIIQNRELDKLARLWASGLDFDWKILYSTSSHTLIPLPVYPFAHDRYWIRETGETSLEVVIPAKQKLHLLVDCNASTLHEEKFTTLLKGTEFYLADHRIGDKKMLPGVAYIEMARAAGELAGERRVERIRDILWMRPVILNGKPKEISICFYPEDGTVDFEVSSLDSEDEKILHSQGTIIYGDNETKLLEPGTIDVKSIKSRCNEERSDTDCYALFEQSGYKYGLGFRSLKRLYYNENEGISEIELPEHIMNTLDEFYLHPSLMDASIQTVLGIIQKRGNGKVMPFLPFSLDELVIYSRLPGSCVAYVRAKNEVSPDVRIFDIVIAEHSGKILVSMNNFTLRRYVAHNGHSKAGEKGGKTGILTDEQLLEMLEKLKTGAMSPEDAEKIIGNSYINIR
jgi:polyketide synthase PksN